MFRELSAEPQTTTQQLAKLLKLDPKLITAHVPAAELEDTFNTLSAGKTNETREQRILGVLFLALFIPGLLNHNGHGQEAIDASVVLLLAGVFNDEKEKERAALRNRIEADAMGAYTAQLGAQHSLKPGGP